MTSIEGLHPSLDWISIGAQDPGPLHGYKGEVHGAKGLSHLRIGSCIVSDALSVAEFIMATKRKADCTPEEWERLLELGRKYRKKHHQTEGFREKSREKHKRRREAHGDIVRAKDRERYYRIKESSPEKLKEKEKRSYARNAEKQKAKSRRKLWKGASPARARQLMLDLYRLAPNIPSRDEIVAAAALLVLEGANLKDALRKAATQTLNAEYKQKYAKQIEECYWL